MTAGPQQLPPYDDEPPPDYEPHTPRLHNNQPNADYNAEQAVLGALLADPTNGHNLLNELNPDDFYWPKHQTLWNTWHHLAQQPTGPPDYVTLNAHLVTTGDTDSVRLIPDLLTACPNPAAATAYTKIVRDTARLRTITDLAQGLKHLAQTSRVDQIDSYLAEAVQQLDDTITRFGPTTTTTATGLHDLTWILTGTPPTVPPPTIGQRTDGHHLFYAGKVNGIFGDPESAKTWLAQAAGVEALNNGGTLAMIDVDHNGPDHTAARLLLLGAHIKNIADPNKFRYYEPEDANELKAAVTDITNRAPTVTIIDSLGEIFPMLGANTNDGDELTTAMRQICTRPATAGSCVITIDHLPKSVEARTTGYAIGSIAKKRMIRGSYLRAETRTQPAPGQIGRITLRIEKDTAGELRKSSGGGYAGTFTLDSTHEHTTTWAIALEHTPTNADGSFRPTNLMERVSSFIETNDQANFSEIKEAIGGKDKWIRDALTSLVTDGFVARLQGPKNSKLHHSIAPYREAEDDLA